MKDRLSSLVALTFSLALASSLAAQVARDGRAVSPFRGMRAVAGGIEVQVLDDTWHALESVAGVDAATLLREAERLAGDRAWKRITEDLPALLDAMGTQVGDAVDVRVRDLATQQVHVLAAVEMTGANRQRLWRANNARDGAATAPPPLTAAHARADLQHLRTLLDTAFAYRELRPVDVDALLRDAERQLGDGPVEVHALARVVDGVLRAFGDGHSRIDAAPLAAGGGYPPFLVQEVAGGHVAFTPDRRGFVDAERPFVIAIDGVPLAKWLAASAARATQGSPAMRARDAERGLRELGALREALALPAQPRLTLTLAAAPTAAGAAPAAAAAPGAAAAGAAAPATGVPSIESPGAQGAPGARDVVLDLARKRPTYGEWPRTATRRLDGDLGYLRLAEMRGDAAFLEELDGAMRAFRDTKGLVIDVRGNGGGSRDALRRLAPYLLPADGAPVVGNVASVLLERGEPAAPDALADRGLYPLEWTGWSDAQRSAITQFARTWRPSWKLPAGRFSPPFFLVLDRADHPAAFHYDRKVVVLIDRGCFSATDVFAAALGALPSVTLVGEPTSGGSGRARTACPTATCGCSSRRWRRSAPTACCSRATASSPTSPSRRSPAT